MTKNNRELLAPGGGFDEIIAAFNAGADAVYTGLKSYSARKLAKNLDLDELDYVVKYAHSMGKKIFVAINTIMYDLEIENLIEMIDEIISKAPDAIIVQDIGLFSVLKKLYPDIELHASTQMTADNLYAVKNLSELGFDRVVVARELSLDEIIDIKNHIDVDLEVFVHGALCVCYSGDCYFSSSIGTRSANRGDCAQPCRKRYDLIVNGQKTNKNGFYLSMKDLNSSTDLKKLVGVADSFKIEGRMKSKEYVYTITKFYDDILNNKNIDHEQELNVSDAFSRGFTKGFLFDGDKDEIINKNSPKHIGSLVGYISRDKGKFFIKTTEKLNAGDGITFPDENKKSQGIKLDKNYNAGANIYLDVKSIDGSKVYRNYSERLYDDLSDVNIPKKLPLEFIVCGKAGENLKLIAKSGGKSVEYISDFVLEHANKFKDYSVLYEQLSRVGDTFFEISDIKILLEDGLFVPKSILNDARRSAIEMLIAQDTLNRKSDFNKIKNKNTKRSYPELCAIVNGKIKLSDNFKWIGCELIDEEIFRFYKENGFKTILITDSICTKNYCELVREFLKLGLVDMVEVNNYGLIDLSKEFEVIAGDGLNITNSYAIEYLNSLNIKNIVPSREISINEINNLKQKTYSNIIIPYYKNTISMKNKAVHPEIKTEIDANNEVYIRDIKNEEFKVDRFNNIYRIYNSKPLFMAKNIDDINADMIMIEVDKNIDEVMKYLLGEIDSVGFDYTTGHYRRGV